MGAGSVGLCGEELVTFGVGSGTLGVGSTALGAGSTTLGVGSTGCRRHNGWAGGAAGFSIAGGSTAAAVLRYCGGAGGALAGAASRYACVGVLGRICDEGVDTAHSR